MTLPNKKNFCGGAFSDWLEINLLSECNGSCSWCIEKDGYHPLKHVGWSTIVSKAIGFGAKNVILLGGEPTLYKDIKLIINNLSLSNINVWMTTNGSLLTPVFIKNNLRGITGINISIHHHNMLENFKVTGIKIDKYLLVESIKTLHFFGASVRLNCNCISGAIDNIEDIYSYMGFAKEVGADKIRFAEIKNDNDSFVNLAKLFTYQHGLNDDPFVNGCNRDVIINSMPINFRQMCGLQTEIRKKPIDPQIISKKVLYYDGKFYNGWQNKKKEKVMTNKELIELLRNIENGSVTPEAAAWEITESTIFTKTKNEERSIVYEDTRGCTY